MGTEATHHFLHMFPHYVTVGGEHIDPDEPVIRGVYFAVDDLSSLFYDFDAFGQVIDARPIIDAVLAERRLMRPVEVGDSPCVAYFTGKFSVIEVETAIGTFGVSHRPSSNFGGPDGVFIKNRMVVSLEPLSPVTFAEAMDRMMIIARFLSVIAGREQGVYDIKVQTVNSNDEAPDLLSVYWSYAPRGHALKGKRLKPHPGDVPLDPIQRPKEFSDVLTNWIQREPGWRLSRIRFMNCLSKDRFYDYDRLVAAANMFDILPAEAVPPPTVLSDDLTEAQAMCLGILEKLAPCQDRDSAISALKRLGGPSLPRKIQHHTELVVKHFGTRFEDLSYVVRLAGQYRNYLVHGGAARPKAIAIAPFLSFLTDALEFVFAASDLIEAGWDASRWNREPHGDGHIFGRFRAEYWAAISELKRSTASAS